MNRERAAEAMVMAGLCAAALLVAGGSRPATGSPPAPAGQSTQHASAASSVRTSSYVQIGASQAALATATSPSGDCDQATPRTAPAGLPWPAVISTGCGRYEVRPSGRVRTLPEAKPVRASRSLPAWGADAAKVQHGHVVIVSGRRTMWRSRGASFRLQDLDSVVVGGPGVAFSVYRSSASALYFAPGRSAERRTGKNLEALEWTPAGTLLVSRWHTQGRPDLRLLDGAGVAVKTLVRATRGYALDPSTGDVLFVDTSDRLRRADGDPASDPATLADLRSMGFRLDLESWFPGITPLADGRIVLSAPDRMVILSGAGRLQAEATFAVPSQGYGWVGSQDSLTVDPVTGAIVFIVTRWDYTNGTQGWNGWEGVYRLGDGDTKASLLWGKRMYLAPCAHYSSMVWRGRWLLYSACEGHVVAIDVDGAHDPVDLSKVSRRLPAPDDQHLYPVSGAIWATAAGARAG